jgi:hypothetical protein
VLALGAAALALGLAGCGGGRLSHGAFVRQADAVCSAYQAKVDLLAKPTSYDDVTAYVERTLPLYQAGLKRLAALKPPAADARAVTAWLAADRRVAVALRRLRAAAMRHDLPATTAAAAAVQDAGNRSLEAARTLGLKVCSAP